MNKAKNESADIKKNSADKSGGGSERDMKVSGSTDKATDGAYGKTTGGATDKMLGRDRQPSKEAEPTRIIDAEAVRNAQATLRLDKLGKAHLDRRIVEIDKWYRVRHRDCMTERRG